MSQTQALIATLKRALKGAGKTYRDVAEALELSEASVKRLMSSERMSLERLESICSLIGLQISDLVALQVEQAPAAKNLSLEAEQQIVADPLLLLVAVSVLNRWTLEELIDHYRLSETEGIQKLAQLDRLGLIELLPGNRIRRRVAPDFHWRDNGPIQRFFLQRVAGEFFNARFERASDRLHCVNAMLSVESNRKVQQRLQQLAAELSQLSDQDAKLPLDQRHGTTLVLALRQWQSSLFQEWLR